MTEFPWYTERLTIYQEQVSLLCFSLKEGF
jgi:hypothetical protein